MGDPEWPAVSVSIDNAFPYLDTEMYWNEQEELEFRVHLKPNQQLKYLNKGSCHTSECFRSIQQGVQKRLAKITTKTEENANQTLDDIYPDHFAALYQADLVSNVIPTLAKAQAEQETELISGENAALKKKRERDRKRSIPFTVGQCTFWKVPIHVTIKKIKARFPSLSWLRISMSYRRFSNFGEMLQGDLSSKLNKRVISLDFESLPCNCRVKDEEGNCLYGEDSRKKIAVYETICLVTGDKYTGCTQQFVKIRDQQHVKDTKDRVYKDRNSDSFAHHFSQFIPSDCPRKDSGKFIRRTVKIVWKGDPMGCVKTFGTEKCKLCARERLSILKQLRGKAKDKTINTCDEIYGACRHLPRFHRFKTSDTPPANTVEPEQGERVDGPLSTTSTTSTFSNYPDPHDPSVSRANDIIPSPEMTSLGRKIVRSHGYRTRAMLALMSDDTEVMDDEQGDLDPPDFHPFDSLDNVPRDGFI